LLENRPVYFCRLGSIELPQKQEIVLRTSLSGAQGLGDNTRRCR
jgi:hypothetical protein